MEYRLTTPCTAQDLAPLKAGDTVLLSGVVYTARDQAHKRMIEALDKGEALPFDLTGSAIYYVGPTPERPGEVIGSAGPTTSGRMDAMSPRLLDLGNKIMIGKGKRDAAVKEAVVRNGAVYLAALSGAPPDRAGYAPDRDPGRPRRRSVPVRPGGVSGKRKLTGFCPLCTKQNRPGIGKPAVLCRGKLVCLHKLPANCLHQRQKCDIL